jgi:hypothetical protein
MAEREHPVLQTVSGSSPASRHRETAGPFPLSGAQVISLRPCGCVCIDPCQALEDDVDISANQTASPLNQVIIERTTIEADDLRIEGASTDFNIGLDHAVRTTPGICNRLSRPGNTVDMSVWRGDSISRSNGGTTPTLVPRGFGKVRKESPGITLDRP